MKSPLEVAEQLEQHTEKPVSFLAECYIKLYHENQILKASQGRLLIDLFDLEDELYNLKGPGVIIESDDIT